LELLHLIFPVISCPEIGLLVSTDAVIFGAKLEARVGATDVLEDNFKGIPLWPGLVETFFVALEVEVEDTVVPGLDEVVEAIVVEVCRFSDLEAFVEVEVTIEDFIDIMDCCEDVHLDLDFAEAAAAEVGPTGGAVTDLALAFVVIEAFDETKFSEGALDRTLDETVVACFTEVVEVEAITLGDLLEEAFG